MRIDLAYPELKIAIELDSWKYHGGDNLTAFTDDRAKKNDLHRDRVGADPASPSRMSDEYFVDDDPRLCHDAAIRARAAA